MRVFSYKITRDFGFAPNPYGGCCTLATCKPGIREHARTGDLVVGCGSSALNMVGKIIFVMRVAERMTFDQYWSDQRFIGKRAYFQSGRYRAYGDNIYHFEDGRWIQEDSHHSLEGGVLNTLNSTRDLSSNAVLVGFDFTYWGRAAVDVPAHLRVNEDLYPQGIRDYKANYSPLFVDALTAWFDQRTQRGVLGRPASW